MADQKLSDLTALPTPITTGDLLYVARAGAEYKASSTDLPSSPTAVTAAAVLADTALIVGSGGVRGAASSTLSGIPLLTSGVPTASNVTNDAQTKAAIVPNTAPAAGALLVGNASGTAYASVAASGDVSVASTGVITVTKTSGTAFGALATVTPGTGVATALAINVGATGAFTTFDGAHGTPSSIVLTNATGTAKSLVAGNVPYCTYQAFGSL